MGNRFTDKIKRDSINITQIFYEEMEMKKLFSNQLLLLTVFAFWLKTELVYFVEFNLGVEGAFQIFLLLINPIATALIIFSLIFLIPNRKLRTLVTIVVYFALSMLLYANVLYYREFSDFLSVNLMTNVGNVSEGLNGSTFALLKWHDILYWVDFAVVIFALLKFGKTYEKKRRPFKFQLLPVILGVGMLLLNISLAEIDRPQLLTRTFDQRYLVKYLGVNTFTAYDGLKLVKTQQKRVQADSSDTAEAENFVNANRTATDNEYFGVAKKRNVVYLHLESIQQFLINYKLDGEEVTPFLNELYNSENSFSFSNFYHQTGQGKSSDAENLIENSLFGLPQGSAFSTYGGTNAFQAGPAILKNEQGYTSAAFHGNIGSFWNRNNAYKRFGYDYFFDSSYYDVSKENSTDYGLKDKPFFEQSMRMLKQLPQPFQTKFITVSNHFPYPVFKEDVTFANPGTKDETINNYFSTAHYADAAIKDFFDALKKEGLYENTIFVLYGDHYGISKSRLKNLAPLLGKEELTAFDKAQLQRVPFIIHAPGIKGKEITTQAGQIDVQPTIQHLLGIDGSKYLQLGNSLLSDKPKDTVVFRNGDVITSEFAQLGSKVYRTKTGELVEELSPEEEEHVTERKHYAETALRISDDIMQRDLLRFYEPSEDFKLPTVSKIDYKLSNSDIK